MSELTPLFIDLAGRIVIIVGGGSVAERKAQFFRTADVTVVSPTFTPELERMGAGGMVRLEHRKVTRDMLENLFEKAFLVVAATDDPGLNEEIGRFCLERGIPVNSASGPTGVVVPSVIDCSEIKIAISTGGRSPAMARYLRRRLEGAITEDDRAMVRLQETLRHRLKSMVGDQRERERLLGLVLEDEMVWKALGTSESDALAQAFRVIDSGREP